MIDKKKKYFYQVGAKKAFKTLNNTFTDLAVTSRQAHVNSFLKKDLIKKTKAKYLPLSTSLHITVMILWDSSKSQTL